MCHVTRGEKRELGNSTECRHQQQPRLPAIIMIRLAMLRDPHTMHAVPRHSLHILGRSSDDDSSSLFTYIPYRIEQLNGQTHGRFHVIPGTKFLSVCHISDHIIHNRLPSFLLPPCFTCFIASSSFFFNITIRHLTHHRVSLYAQKAQEAPKQEKGKWMWRHKSFGLLTGIVVAPRVAYRVFNRAAYNVEKIAGSGQLEHSLSSGAHILLYGFMIGMPASGIAMGYYGGKGLPFFWTTIPGVVKTDENKKQTGQIAKNAFNFHKTMGVYGKYLVPLHVAGAFGHFARGQTIFARMNPFSPRPKH